MGEAEAASAMDDAFAGESPLYYAMLLRQELFQDLIEAVGLLEVRGVTRPFEQLEAGARDCFRHVA